MGGIVHHMNESGIGRYVPDVGSWGSKPVAKTAAYTVKETESGTVFTTNGATASVTFTLPTPKENLWYTFVKMEAAYNLVLQCGTGIKINNGTAAQVYKNTTTTEVASCTIVGLSTTEWFVVAEKGTWANAAS